MNQFLNAKEASLALVATVNGCFLESFSMILGLPGLLLFSSPFSASLSASFLFLSNCLVSRCFFSGCVSGKWFCLVALVTDSAAFSSHTYMQWRKQDYLKRRLTAILHKYSGILQVQWNLIIKELWSDITRWLCWSQHFIFFGFLTLVYQDSGNCYGPKDLVIARFHCYILPKKMNMIASPIFSCLYIQILNDIWHHESYLFSVSHFILSGFAKIVFFFFNLSEKHETEK